MSDVPPSDVPPPYDHQRWAYEINRNEAQRAHDQLAQFHQSANEAAIRGGDAALRAALLINGGAAISVLAFIGGLAAQERIELDQLKDVADSLKLFAFGVIAAVVGMAFAYLTHYAVAAITNSYERRWEPPYTRPGKNTRKLHYAKYCLHGVALVAAAGSIALFVWGVLDVRHAISGLKSAVTVPVSRAAGHQHSAAQRNSSMQCAVAACEPRRRLGDLLGSTCPKHCAHKTVGTERSLKFFRRGAEIDEQDLSANELVREVLIATYDCPSERFQACHWRHS